MIAFTVSKIVAVIRYRNSGSFLNSCFDNIRITAVFPMIDIVVIITEDTKLNVSLIIL
jgi:hypothetical protein